MDWDQGGDLHQFMKKIPCPYMEERYKLWPPCWQCRRTPRWPHDYPNANEVRQEIPQWDEGVYAPSLTDPVHNNWAVIFEPNHDPVEFDRAIANGQPPAYDFEAY